MARALKWSPWKIFWILILIFAGILGFRELLRFLFWMSSFRDSDNGLVVGRPSKLLNVIIPKPKEGCEDEFE